MVKNNVCLLISSQPPTTQKKNTEDMSLSRGNPAAHFLLRSHAIRWNAGDPLAKHKPVNVFGAFISVNTFKISHVATGLIFVGDSVCTEDVARHARDF